MRVAFALNPESTTWNGPMWGLVLASMGLAALAPIDPVPRVLDRPGRMDDRVVAGLPLPAYLSCHGIVP
jgi:uncharacterized membrane protein YkvA (DUF1232 family)